MSKRLSEEELADLLAKAEKATPGPWFVGRWGGRCRLEHKHSGPPACEYGHERMPGYYSEGTGIASESPGKNVVDSGYEGAIISEADAEHIAATSPATVAALVREVQRLREEVADLKFRAEDETYRQLDEANHGDD